jgi:hypothetical protein
MAVLNGARKFGERGDCDLPLITAQGQMQWLKENLRGELKPSLIIWTGDSASHAMVQMTEDQILTTIKILSDLIKEAFPSIPIVFSIGNHDFEPSNV